MQTVYVLIGAPACGKTRWALYNARALDATILSADVVRDKIRRTGGDPFDGDRVFAEVGNILAQHLGAGQSVILDATHWRREYRAYAIQAARAAGAQVVGVWFDVPLNVCLRRNETRMGSSPGLRREEPDTIARIHSGLEPPAPGEFDRIQRITLDDEREAMADPSSGEAVSNAGAMRELIRQAGQAWVNGDAEAFAALFAPDGEFVVPGKRWQGQAAIREVLADFARRHSQVRVDIRRILVDGQRAVVEWRWQDVDDETGAVNQADDAIVVEVAGGRIVRWREYIDARTPAARPE